MFLERPGEVDNALHGDGEVAVSALVSCARSLAVDVDLDEQVSFLGSGGSLLNMYAVDRRSCLFQYK